MRGRPKTTYGLGFGLALLMAGPISAVQQIPLPPNSATGLTVTPAYEGWYENADGTFSLSFGYYNRNSGEILATLNRKESKGQLIMVNKARPRGRRS